MTTRAKTRPLDRLRRGNATATGGISTFESSPSTLQMVCRRLQIVNPVCEHIC